MLTGRSRLESIISELAAIGPDSYSRDQITDLLRNTSISKSDLLPYLRWKRSTYTRNLIHRATTFEMLTMCWAAGSHTPIHDHDGQHCHVLVVSGSLLVEEFVVEKPDTRNRSGIRHFSSTVVSSGEIEPAGPIHRVTAAQEAISVHIHVKPLDRCNVYEIETQGCTTIMTNYDSMPR